MKITQETLQELFYYKDGNLITKKSRLGVKKDYQIGCLNFNGYIYAIVLGKKSLLHRLIFLYHHGFLPVCVDHIDGNPLNNKIENLRQATVAENLWNSKKPTTNTSGIKGVWFDKSRNKWYAEFKTNGKKNYVGRFDTIEEATKELHKVRESKHKQFTRHS